VNVHEDIEQGQKDRPVDELLAAYAAGSLNTPLMALMAAHLELKPARRAYVAALEAAYGILLEDIEPVPLTNRDRRLVAIFASENGDGNREPAPVARALNGYHHRDEYRNGNSHPSGGHSDIQVDGHDDSPSLDASVEGAARNGQAKVLPSALRNLVGEEVDELMWRRAASGVELSLIAAGGFGEASLMRIRAGKRTPAHGHDGREVTLVLAGGLSDGNGRYYRGDICVADEAVEHQLIADPGEDCVAFVVSAGPMRIFGAMDRFIRLVLRRSAD
jgi:putative transcriptional regulator